MTDKMKLTTEGTVVYNRLTQARMPVTAMFANIIAERVIESNLELKQLRAQNKILIAENKRLMEYYYAVESALI